MVELDSTCKRLVLVLVIGLPLAACGSSGAGKPKSASVETEQIIQPEPAEATAEEDTAPEFAEAPVETEPIQRLPETLPEPIAEEPQDSEESEEVEDESVVVIDTGFKDLTEKPASLAEAAQAERERRNLAAPTDIVITDKTLADYATGQLTVAERSTREGSDSDSQLSEDERRLAEEEAYWRSGALEIRLAWRDAHDRVEELEGKIFELRQQFYREDDGFYRDSEIKPAWDRAIDQLDAARLEVETRRQELVDFTDEGRAAGAFPGWLREGIDLEPPETVEKEETAEPTEPVIYRQEATDPP